MGCAEPARQSTLSAALQSCYVISTLHCGFLALGPALVCQAGTRQSTLYLSLLTTTYQDNTISMNHAVCIFGAFNLTEINCGLAQQQAA